MRITIKNTIHTTNIPDISHIPQIPQRRIQNAARSMPPVSPTSSDATTMDLNIYNGNNNSNNNNISYINGINYENEISYSRFELGAIKVYEFVQQKLRHVLLRPGKKLSKSDLINLILGIEDENTDEDSRLAYTSSKWGILTNDLKYIMIWKTISETNYYGLHTRRSDLIRCLVYGKYNRPWQSKNNRNNNNNNNNNGQETPQTKTIAITQEKEIDYKKVEEMCGELFNNELFMFFKSRLLIDIKTTPVLKKMMKEIRGNLDDNDDSPIPLIEESFNKLIEHYEKDDDGMELLIVNRLSYTIYYNLFETRKEKAKEKETSPMKCCTFSWMNVVTIQMVHIHYGEVYQIYFQYNQIQIVIF